MIEDISRFVPGTRVRRGGPLVMWNGVVVFNNTLGLYSEEFPKDDWGYLGKGFMVRYDEVGLVFTEEVDDEEIIEKNSHGNRNRVREPEQGQPLTPCRSPRVV